MDRGTYVGGTVVAALLGASGWNDAAGVLYELIAAYHGIYVPTTDPKSNRDMLRGHLLEPVVVELIRLEYDDSIRQTSEENPITHPKSSFVGGHPDAIGRRVYEIKCPRAVVSSVKPEWFWQLAHYVNLLRQNGLIDHTLGAVVQLDYESFRPIIFEIEFAEEELRRVDSVALEAGEILREAFLTPMRSPEDVYRFLEARKIDVSEYRVGDPRIDDLAARYESLSSLKREIDSELSAIRNVLRGVKHLGTRVVTGRINTVVH